jgi:hypothetical protein
MGPLAARLLPLDKVTLVVLVLPVLMVRVAAARVRQGNQHQVVRAVMDYHLQFLAHQ